MGEEADWWLDKLFLREEAFYEEYSPEEIKQMQDEAAAQRNADLRHDTNAKMQSIARKLRQANALNTIFKGR